MSCGPLQLVDGGSLGTITVIDAGINGSITRLGCCPSVPQATWTADEWLMDWADVPYGPTSIVLSASPGSGGGEGGPQLAPATLTPGEPTKLPGDTRTGTGGPTDPGPDDNGGGGGGGHTTNNGSTDWPGGLGEW